MCRLLGYVSRQPESIRGLLKDTYPSFEEFSCGLHGDGWGMAWHEDGVIRTHKEPVPAFSSERYRTLSNDSFDAAFVHYRWATLALEVTMGNTHPFASSSVAFAHNGSISPPDAVAGLITEPSGLSDLEGTTDSERYFRAVLSASHSSGFENGFREVIASIQERLTYTSLNAVMLTPDDLYAVCFYNPENLSAELPPDYYEMNFLATDDAVVVASSGWEHAPWPTLANGNMLRVSRTTRDIEITQVATVNQAS